MKQKIAIYGAGGFGREVACMINAINENEFEPKWDLIGYFDDGLPKGFSNKYGSVLGGIEDLNRWDEPLNVVFSIATADILKSIIDQIANSNLVFPNLVAPNVLFLDKKTVKMGKGNLIFFGTRISCDVTIGDFNLMNGHVSLGHDASLGNFNVLGPMVRISGNTSVQDVNFFGVQSTVLQGLKIGSETKIGAGSIVMRNTKNGFLYMGNPAKKIVL
jgi:sugar O-acyltransferase (sialic acid O-acetyltransferase NeuD family)